MAHGTIYHLFLHQLQRRYVSGRLDSLPDGWLVVALPVASVALVVRHSPEAMRLTQSEAREVNRTVMQRLRHALRATICLHHGWIPIQI